MERKKKKKKKKMKKKAEQIKTCKNCRYWEELERTGSKTKFGTCRFNPPRVIGEGTFTIWPETTKDDWCGVVLDS